jgi:hypothetical protein
VIGRGAREGPGAVLALAWADLDTASIGASACITAF